jgi:hypothetical protein
MPARSPTTRGGAQKKATPQELVVRGVWTNEMAMVEAELAETQAALASELAAKGKLLSVADGERLQLQVELHEKMRAQAVEEARDALKKCSDMAQELATERAKALQLHEALQRDRASAVKFRAALGPLVALVGDIYPDLLPNVSVPEVVTSLPSSQARPSAPAAAAAAAAAARPAAEAHATAAAAEAAAAPAAASELPQADVEVGSTVMNAADATEQGLAA